MMTKVLELVKLKNIAGKRKLSVESEPELFCDSPPVENQLYGGKDIIYIERQEGDSLQKMAVNFNCTVAEIKFVNKIYNEQELHALKTVKIPVIKDGALFHKYNDKIEEGSTISLASSEDLSEFSEISNGEEFKYTYKLLGDEELYKIRTHFCEDEHDICNCETEHLLDDNTVLLNRIHSGPPVNASETTFPEFMNQMDEKIKKNIEEVESKNENFQEVVNMLKDGKDQVVFSVDRTSRPETSGSICPFTWGHFILIICVIAVIVPIIYLIHFLHAKWK